MPNILNVVDVQAPCETVHRLVATAEGISRWWTPTVTSKPNAGGRVVGDENAGDENEGDGSANHRDQQLTIRFGTDWRILLEKLEETASLVRWRIVEHDSDEWRGTDLVFRLTHADGWTTLEFDHAGWAEATSFFRFCSTKWPMFLLSIKRAAETGGGTPYPGDIKIGRND